MGKHLLLLSGVLAVAGACTLAPKFLAGEASGQGQAVNVTRLYNDTCAKCHGVEGQGGGAGTRTLLTDAKFSQDLDRPFFDAIKNGVPDQGMEAYGPTMRDEEVWAMVVHIRELQAKALRAAKGSTKPVEGVVKTQRHSYRIEEVVGTGQGLKVPWGVDWLPDGRMLVTNRPGTMFVFDKGASVPVEGLPETIENGQGGLMEVAVHPGFARNGWIYLGITDPGKDGNPRSSMTKIVRGKLQFVDGKALWNSQETIYEAAKEFYSGAGVHYGTRIVFDGKGHVFFVVGERGTNMRAQDPATPYGKIMRVMEDGRIPDDNPVKGNPMWSLGHRNPQGLVFGLDGVLWDTEHGPRGGDEFNKIDKGANYGWPVIAFSINYNGMRNGESLRKTNGRECPGMGNAHRFLDRDLADGGGNVERRVAGHKPGFWELIHRRQVSFAIRGGGSKTPASGRGISWGGLPTEV